MVKEKVKRPRPLETKDEFIERIAELTVKVIDLKNEVEHYKKYATHHPTCAKPPSRGNRLEKKCTCGLDKEDK